MRIYLDWSLFKANITNKYALRYIDRENFYSIYYSDFDSSIVKENPANSDQTDFETNYKPFANSSITEEVSPFGSKKIGTKSLLSRATGAAHPIASGSNDLDFNVTYAVCKIDGLEIIGGELGDYANFKIVHPTYGTLGQFAFSNYIAPAFYSRYSKYDADLVSGLIIRIEYESVSAKTIYINYILHEVV
jgi:hypothetical protein